MFVCLLNHSDMIIEIKVHGVLLLFHFVSVLSITNHEKQEKNRVLNDNYLNKMKEISVVLLVQVLLYKFKGDCSF